MIEMSSFYIQSEHQMVQFCCFYCLVHNLWLSLYAVFTFVLCCCEKSSDITSLPVVRWSFHCICSCVEVDLWNDVCLVLVMVKTLAFLELL